MTIKHPSIDGRYTAAGRVSWLLLPKPRRIITPVRSPSQTNRNRPISSFGFLVPGSKFQVSGFKSRLSGFLASPYKSSYLNSKSEVCVRTGRRPAAPPDSGQRHAGMTERGILIQPPSSRPLHFDWYEPLCSGVSQKSIGECGQHVPFDRPGR